LLYDVGRIDLGLEAPADLDAGQHGQIGAVQLQQTAQGRAVACSGPVQELLGVQINDLTHGVGCPSQNRSPPRSGGIILVSAVSHATSCPERLEAERASIEGLPVWRLRPAPTWRAVRQVRWADRRNWAGDPSPFGSS